jgi:hypothetical protein
MSEVPICPRCNRLFVPLSEHNRQALALANNFPWWCPQCFAVPDGSGMLMSVESVQKQERPHFLAIINSLQTVKTRAVLQEACEVFRAAFATVSQVRYAWANVAPELLRELWGVMELIGGTIPDRLEELMDKPSVSERYIQRVLQAITEVVRWCEGPNVTRSQHESPIPAVDEEDLRILQCVANAAPRLLSQDEIEAESRISRRTISKRLRGLLESGLVRQPKGPKSGTTITPDGQTLLAKLNPPGRAQ